MTMFLIIRDISSFSGAIYNLFQKCGLSPPNCFYFSFLHYPELNFACCAAMLPNQTTHLHMSTSSSPSDLLPGGLMRLQGAPLFCAGKGSLDLMLVLQEISYSYTFSSKEYRIYILIWFPNKWGYNLGQKIFRKTKHLSTLAESYSSTQIITLSLFLLCSFCGGAVSSAA